MYLLNTNVISALRNSRPHAGVLAWVDAVPEAQAIEAWLNQVAQSYRVLAADARPAWFGVNLEKINQPLGVFPLFSAPRKKSKSTPLSAWVTVCKNSFL